MVSRHCESIHDNDHAVLSIAVQYGHLDIVKYFLKKGCSINDRILDYIAKHEDSDIAKYLDGYKE
jgi:ankyrin repeat protein